MELLMLNMIIRRFKEPSSWAGFSAIAVAFGMSTDLYNQIVIVVAGICGLLAMVMNDPAHEADD